MRLFLTSSTITPNLVHDFEDFMGRGAFGIKAAFIPDAGLKNSGDHSWIDEDMNNDLIKGLKWDVTKVTLAEESYESLEKLFDYDVVYVNGGYSGYLARAMRRSGFDRRLPELFEREIVYVGSSAGSMVLSKVQDAASFYFGEPEPDALEIGGLGIVDFEFYPMHDSRWTPDLVEKIKAKRNKNLQYFLVRDGQAVSVVDGAITTFGDVITLNQQ